MGVSQACRASRRLAIALGAAAVVAGAVRLGAQPAESQCRPAAQRTLRLHDASLPAIALQHDWKPKGLCEVP